MKQEITFQRIEGIAIFIVSLAIYVHMDFSILIFMLLLLTFDVFMLGYLFNAKIGAFMYNLGHSLTLPLIVGAVGYFIDARLVIAFSLIWLAHIGLDRAFGYGLKLKSGFKDTHLGRIGKD